MPQNEAMIVEIGHFALILAFIISVMQAGAGLAPLSAIPAQISQFAKRAAILQFLLCLLAWLSLGWAFIVSDLSVLAVVKNSHSYKPLLYKIAGIWGNHEGSMLLWVLILSFFGFLLRRTHDVRIIGTQGLLGAGFLSFILFTSNPFRRIVPPPIDGAGLNPVLQDPALAVHPPLLYIGYVGFSVAFSYAVAALISGKADADWGRRLKPWVLAAWTSLSAGIALGSWWAYYELGWGGWWFWDPVENAALLPWLLGTALLHSVIVLEKRDALRRWTVLLCLLSFSLSMLGTFLVRSGVLTSVHAFALDPARGIYILILLGLFTGGSLILYALKAETLAAKATFAPLSREGALVINNLFLTAMSATVLTGTLYPLVMQAVDGPALSVGPPYFHATIVPLAVPLVILMAAGPFLPWKKADLKGVIQRLWTAIILTLLAMLAVLALQPAHPGFSLLGIGLAAWLVTATLAEWAGRAGIRRGRQGVWPRIRGMKAEGWSLTLAHAGLGMAIIGMTGTGLWTQEKAAILKPGDTMVIADYTLTLERVAPAFGTNYSAIQAEITIDPRNRERFSLLPERRYYPIAQKDTAEAAIHTSWRDDIYIVLGGRDDEAGGWIIHAWTHPGIPFLWLGFGLVVLGGVAGLAGNIKRKK